MSAFLCPGITGKKLNEDYISKENGWERKGEMKLTCSILGFENVYNLDGEILNWHYDVIKGIPEERNHINALLQQIEEPKGGGQQ